MVAGVVLEMEMMSHSACHVRVGAGAVLGEKVCERWRHRGVGGERAELPASGGMVPPLQSYTHVLCVPAPHAFTGMLHTSFFYGEG